MQEIYIIIKSEFIQNCNLTLKCFSTRDYCNKIWHEFFYLAKI
jgi:hypothetical protein